MIHIWKFWYGAQRNLSENERVVRCEGRAMCRFFLEFEGKRIVISKSLKQKSIQLLMLLLKAGSDGIPRKKLAEMLEWEIDGWEKKLNNLRCQTYRLRRLIEELEFLAGENRIFPKYVGDD